MTYRFTKREKEPMMDFPTTVFKCQVFKPSGKWYMDFYLTTIFTAVTDYKAKYELMEDLREYMKNRTEFKNMYITVNNVELFPIMFMPIE